MSIQKDEIEFTLKTSHSRLFVCNIFNNVYGTETYAWQFKPNGIDTNYSSLALKTTFSSLQECLTDFRNFYQEFCSHYPIDNSLYKILETMLIIPDKDNSVSWNDLLNKLKFQVDYALDKRLTSGELDDLLKVASIMKEGLQMELEISKQPREIKINLAA